MQEEDRRRAERREVECQKKSSVQDNQKELEQRTNQPGNQVQYNWPYKLVSELIKENLCHADKGLSEQKAGKCGENSRTGYDQIPLFYVCLSIFFACQNHPGVLKNMFYKSGKVISDQFEHLYMFSFWGNSENGCRGGGVPLFPLHFVTKC